MSDPESATGILITCAGIIFLSFCVLVRILHALDEEESDSEEWEEQEE